MNVVEPSASRLYVRLSPKFWSDPKVTLEESTQIHDTGRCPDCGSDDFDPDPDGMELLYD